MLIFVLSNYPIMETVGLTVLNSYKQYQKSELKFMSIFVIVFYIIIVFIYRAVFGIISNQLKIRDN